MFSIYNDSGRYFRNTLEELYRVESINFARRARRASSREEDGYEQEQPPDINSEAINAYRRVINARREQEIHHASQIMRKPVITVDEETSTSDCYLLVEQKGIKQLPVLNGERTPVGLITKENLLKVLIVDNDTILHRETESIKDIIIQPMITADPVTDIRRIAKVMFDQKLNCIPITNEADKILGIITRTDIVHAVSIFPGITLWA